MSISTSTSSNDPDLPSEQKSKFQFASVAMVAASGALDGADQLPESIRRRIGELRTNSMAKETLRGHTTRWRQFEQWCDAHDLESLPASPLTLIHYLVDRAETLDSRGHRKYSPTTVALWVYTINKAHHFARYPEPGKNNWVRDVLDGIRRENARQRRQAKPITLDLLHRLVKAIDLNDTTKGVINHRDYAILVLGFSGAFRRSELTNLTLEDVTLRSGEGLLIHVGHSKTDQLHHGFTKGLPFGEDTRTCPPCALIRWLRILETSISAPSRVAYEIQRTTVNEHECVQGLSCSLASTQPLFPAVRKAGWVTSRPAGSDAVSQVVKNRVASIGLDPDGYSGHSLRAGFVTQAFRFGASTHEIMRQTGHRSPATVEIYSREIDPMLHNAVGKLGL